MNKKNILLLLVLGLFSCNLTEKEIKIPASNIHMVPRLDDNQSLIDNTPEETLEDIDEILPHIPIGSDYKVVTIIETNLDMGIDDDDEQIILLQTVTPDEQTSSLELWIAEYRPNRNEYILSWKTNLKCELPETAVIQVRNIAGSRESEILVSGFTKENYQTLDIFLNGDKVNKFKNIFSISARGSIEIQYQDQIANENNGSPVNILISESEQDVDENFIIINSVWQLNPSNNRFIKISQTSKLQDEQQREEIVRILKGDEESFLQFLDGFWYKEDSISEDGSQALLYMDSKESSIIFYYNNEFELYDIQYTHKGIYSKLYINSVNSNIRNTSRTMSITLQELNQLHLTVEDNNDKTAVQSSWSGNYKRMTDSLLMDYREPYYDSIAVLDFLLKGKYKNIEGTELHFDTAQIFTWKENGKESNGSYALMEIDGIKLLELVFYNRRGMVTERYFYSYILNQEEDENYIVRSLVLTPGKMTIRGFQPSGDKNIAYEQLEVMENEL